MAMMAPTGFSTGSLYPNLTTPNATPQPASNLLSNFNAAGQVQQSGQDQAIIQQALSLLGQIQNLPDDERYMRHLGLNPPFKNGADALRLIQEKGIQVEFGDMGDSPAHAQWIPERNLIMINQRYRGDNSKATLYAISEAIYHEAGHAFGNGDGNSSIQEEMNCLALNTLGNRYHAASDPEYAKMASSSPLIADGVALYSRLFFDPDPYKKGLINRVVQKYGDLPMWSPGHNVPPAPGAKDAWVLPMAYRVAAQVDANNVAKGIMPPSPALSLSQASAQAKPASVTEPAAPIPTPQQVAQASFATPGQQFSYVA